MEKSSQVYFGVRDFGLLTISFSTSPGKHLALFLEVTEYLKQYEDKLVLIHEKYLEQISKDVSDVNIVEMRSGFLKRMSYLYKPQFVSTLGNQDTCVQFLVDDFELLANLPYFEFAEKQDCSLGFIPEFKYFRDFIAAPVLDAIELFQKKSYEAFPENEKEWISLEYPLRAHCLVKFDAFMKFEIGIMTHKDFIEYLLQMAISVNETQGCKIKILPSIAMDWCEVNVTVLSKDLRGIFVFLQKMTHASCEKVLSEPSKKYITSILETTFHKHRLFQYSSDRAYSKEELDAFQASLNALRKQLINMKEYSGVDINSSVDLSALSNEQFLYKLYEMVPESVVFNAFLKKRLKEQSPFVQRITPESIFEHTHLVVFTNTFVGIPLMFSFFKCAQESVDVSLSENDRSNQMIDWVQEKINKYLFDYNKQVFGPAFTSAYNLCSNEAIRKGLHDLRVDGKVLSRFIIEYSKKLEQSLSQDSTIFSAIIDFPMYHFGFTKKNEYLEKKCETDAELQGVIGKSALRKILKQIKLLQFVNEIQEKNREFENALFASTCSSVMFQLKEKFPTEKTLTPVKKIRLKKFEMKHMVYSVAAKMRAMNIAKYVVDNFLSVINAYNHSIQDPVKFESLIEAAPAIWKVATVFNRLSEVRSNGKVVLHYPAINRQAQNLTTKELILLQKELISTFRVFFQQRCLNTKMDEDSFQGNIEKTSSSNMLLSLAAGVQRILFTYFLGEGSKDYIKMASFLVENEEEVFNHKNSLVPKTSLSRRHLLAAEHMPILFHEVGHAYVFSHMYKQLLNEFQSNEQKALIEFLFYPTKKVIAHMTRQHTETIELLDQVIPDLFYFVLCCNCDLKTFFDNFIFHKYYLHNFPRNKNGKLKGDELLHPYWYRVFMITLVVQWGELSSQGGNLAEAVKRAADVTEKFTHLSALSGNGGKSAFSVSNKMKLLDKRVTVIIRKKVKDLRDCHDVFEKLLTIFCYVFNQIKNKKHGADKNSIEDYLENGEIPIIKKPRNALNNPCDHVVSLLRWLTEQVIAPKSNKNMVFDLKISESRDLKKAEIVPPTSDFQWPTNPAPIVLYPYSGAFSIDLEWRGKLFLRRACAMLTLHHIILQEKGDLVTKVLQLQEKDIQLTRDRFSSTLEDA